MAQNAPEDKKKEERRRGNQAKLSNQNINGEDSPKVLLKYQC